MHVAQRTAEPKPRCRAVLRCFQGPGARENGVTSIFILCALPLLSFVILERAVTEACVGKMEIFLQFIGS